MSPDKLFDYLDGKLSPAERDALEARLPNDSQLLRQLAVAREIHRKLPGSREVVVPNDDPAEMERAGRFGRRVATAAIALVALNVFIGVAFIAKKNRHETGAPAQEAAIRQQLAASLGAAGQRALPPPTFVEDEIHLTAPRSEWDNVAAKVIAAAEKCDGSAAKGLPDEAVLTVVADVPSNRIAEFRQLLEPSAAATPPAAAPTAAPNERTVVQVRIAQPAQ